MRLLIGYGFLAPPNVLILLCAFGAIATLAWRRAGLLITTVASLSLFVMATPAFSSCLLVWAEGGIPKDDDLSSAQAIVVPCADVRTTHGMTGGDGGPGPQSLERLLLGAEAYKQFHLPVLVTGGPTRQTQTSCAQIMKVTFERYFEVPVSWTEDRSETTHEDATYTAELLQKTNIHTVIVVTQARDAPRAIWSFEQAGFRALPWPAPRTEAEINQITDFLPDTKALLDTFYAMHEIIGGVYYRFKYQKSPI